MQCYGLTDIGKVRKENQDSFIIEKYPSSGAYVISLCDGMGGANAGKFASRLANSTFVSFVYDKLSSHSFKFHHVREILMDACKEANGTAFEYSKIDSSYSGMGTTLVGGVITTFGRYALVNIGDSRAYYISCGNGTIRQITKDHSLVEEMIDNGIISRMEARKHPQKNVITRALGTDPIVNADFFSGRLKHKDVLLLCSDGLSNLVEDHEILSVATKYHSPKGIAEKLLRITLDRGAGDNISIIVVRK